MLALFFFLATILLLYSNIYDSHFIFDDAQNIKENYLINIQDLTPKNLWQVATSSPIKWRALPNLSFALNYYFGGSMSGDFTWLT